MITLNNKAGHSIAHKTKKSTFLFLVMKLLIGHRGRKITHLATVIALVLFSHKIACCQDFDLIDISNYECRVFDAPSLGDTMAFQIDLGSLLHPTHRVVGFELGIGFPNLETPPSEIWATVDDGWLYDANSSMQSSYDAATRRVQLSYLRKSGIGLTGQGRIATLYLSRPGGFLSSEQLVSLEGGIVMVDNIDFKMAPPKEMSSISSMQVFPNPASILLNVNIPNPMGATLSLYDGNGQQIWQELAQDKQVVPLENLQPGVYLLQLRKADGKLENHKIMVL